MTVDGLSYLEGLSVNRSIRKLYLMFAKVGQANVNKQVKLPRDANGVLQDL